MTMRSYRLDDETVAVIDRLADERFGGNRTAAIRAAVASLAGPSLERDAWTHLQSGAMRRLARAMTEPELETCLDLTNSWFVSGPDAGLIDLELDDAIEDGTDLRHGVDGPALVAKLRAMPEVDRVVLTLRCRWWWEQDPRPPLAQILGRQLRGPRAN